MANLLNIDAEQGANMIGDDAEPTLSITNTSTGPALQLDRAVITSSATISGANLRTISKLDIDTPILAANATVTGIDLRGASVASGAVLSLTGDAAYSLTTIKAITGGAAGTYGVRVALPDGTFGWLPIYPDAAVTAAAVGA